jgi:signal transduction histidine kinase
MLRGRCHFMKNHEDKSSLSLLKAYLVGALLVWTGAISLMFYFNLTQTKELTLTLAKNNAVATIDGDIAYRQWSTLHGGVYVQVSKNAEPNPYLTVPLRDINASGKELTLINPAYMIRQVSELRAKKNLTTTHITSLKPIRPQNTADEWETKALKSFELGARYYSEAIQNPAPKLRVMKAFVTEKGCLKCHAHQGYKEGDIRGGISVTVDMAPYLVEEQKSVRRLIFSHSLLWVLGLLGGLVAFAHFRKSLLELVSTKNKLHSLSQDLQERVDDEAAKRVEKEKLLLQQSKMAMMGEMIGAIGHQWRQPLNSLGIMVQDIEMAKKYGELTDEYLHEFKEESMRIIFTMSKTIDDFKSFYKTDKTEEIFCVESAIGEVLGILSAQLKIASISVVFDQTGRHEMIGLKNELKQVLLNLLSNAKDALLEKKPEEAFIKIECVQDNAKLIISIEDNGGGIKEESLGQIFEPYFTTKSETSGTGIGLYMSKEIVENHMNGKLEVQNTGNGAKFTIILNTNQTKQKEN